MSRFRIRVLHAPLSDRLPWFVVRWLAPQRHPSGLTRRTLRRVVCAIDGHPTASRSFNSSVMVCNWCGAEWPAAVRWPHPHQRTVIENAIHAGAQEVCEAAEASGAYRGNGHHLAQDVARAVTAELVRCGIFPEVEP